MVAEGADLIDIGGESTRPGAPTVSAEEEIDRILPVIEALRREIATPLSIDTTKAAVARAAIAAGAEFINDISGLEFDPEMAATVAAGGAGLFLMHTRGRPDANAERHPLRRSAAAKSLTSLRGGVERAMAGRDRGREARDRSRYRLRQRCRRKSRNPAPTV